MQPTYLPWLGYFELLENCDIFVYLDDVQYVKKTFHSRNKIKAKAGELLLTVPVLPLGGANRASAVQVRCPLQDKELPISDFLNS